MEEKQIVKLKFPDLHKLLPKGKDLDPTSNANYIFIKNNYAFINLYYAIIVIDLKRYFKDKIEVPEDSLDLTYEILNYLNGKLLSYDYWEELTKGNSLSLLDHIEYGKYIQSDSGSLKKDLFYKDVQKEYDIEIPNVSLNFIKKIAIKASKEVRDISLSMAFFNALKTALNSIVKADDITFKFLGISEPICFTFNKNTYIFGVVVNQYENLEDMFSFEEMDEFVKTLVGN